MSQHRPFKTFERDGLKFWVVDPIMFPWPHVSGACGWAFWNPDEKSWRLFTLEDKHIDNTENEEEVAIWCLYGTRLRVPEHGHRMGIEPPILEDETCGMVKR